MYKHSRHAYTRSINRRHVYIQSRQHPTRTCRRDRAIAHRAVHKRELTNCITCPDETEAFTLTFAFKSSFSKQIHHLYYIIHQNSPEFTRIHRFHYRIHRNSPEFTVCLIQNSSICMKIATIDRYLGSATTNDGKLIFIPALHSSKDCLADQ